MENIKFYALCRYMTLKESSSEVINIIHAEIKSLFQEESIPNEDIINEWTNTLESIPNKQKQKHILDVELTNPMNNLKFEFKFDKEPINIQKIKFFAICRSRLTSD